MEKRKLGLIIKIAEDGLVDLRAINKGDWDKFTDDIRPAIKKLENFSGSGKIVNFVKFLGKEGYLFVIVQDPGQGARGSENTAVWIHIPFDAEISADQMKKICDDVVKVLEDKEIPLKDNPQLENVFKKEYDIKDSLASYVETITSKDAGAYAMKYYNGGNLSLQDLLGKNIAQPEYKNYVGVFFVDKESGITFKDESNKVLDDSIIDIVSFQPLPDKDGFKAYIQKPNGEFVKFDKNIEVASGETVTIEWRRKKFAPIDKSGSININYKSDEFSFQSNEIIRRIERSEISVKDENGNVVPNAKITISCDGRKEVLEDFFEFKEDKQNNFCIEASAEGYECYDRRNKVNKYSDQGITLVLTRKRFRYKVNTNNEEISEAELSFFSTNGHPEKSPLEGYELKDKTLNPIGDDKKTSKSEDSLKNKFFSLGFASCFALILLLFGGWHFFKEDTPKQEVKVVTDKERDKDSSKTAQDTAAKGTPTKEELKKKMKSYLSRSMTKDSCKSLGYEELWTALNTYDVDKVEEFAKKFSELLGVVEKLKECDGTQILKELKKDPYVEEKEKIILRDYEKSLEDKLHKCNHSTPAPQNPSDDEVEQQAESDENSNDRPTNS